MSDPFLSLGGKIVEADFIVIRGGEVVCEAWDEHGNERKIHFASYAGAIEFIMAENMPCVH